MSLLLSSGLTGIGLFIVFLGWALPARSEGPASEIGERLRLYAAPPDAAFGEPEGSLMDRIIRPQLERLRAVATQWTPAGYHGRLERQLLLAGGPFGLGPIDYVVARSILALAGFAVATVAGFAAGGPLFGPLAGLVAGALVWVAVDGLLRRAVGRRQESMRRALPDVIDFVVVMMDAGLIFESAMARVVATLHNPLTAELAKALGEVELGRSRAEALEALAERVGVDDVSTFINTVVTGGQMGVPMAKALRTQADELRWRRRERAREKGAQAPVKMTVPVVIFILPTIWLVLLGPSLFSVFKRGL